MTHPGRTVRITAVVVGVAYALALYLSGITLDDGVKKLLAYVPTALVVLVVVFDRWVWNWPGVFKLHNRPRLGGLWKVALAPDPASHIAPGGNWGPIEAYMMIEQTFWSVAISQFTAESESHSRASTFLKKFDSGQCMLSFHYDNTPRREHRARNSPRHVGACELTAPQGAPTRIVGTYFTDRFTAGEMTLELVDRTTNYADFLSAKEHADSV